MNTSALARRFGIRDPKVLRIGALIWILMASCFFVFLKLHHGRRSCKLNATALLLPGSYELFTGIGGTQGTGGQAFCNTTEISDFCETVGDVRVDGYTATVYVAGETTSEDSMWKIKPYARKLDPGAMKNVRQWEVKLVSRKAPSCTHTHSAPGILFSTGGYADNLFHNMADTLLPLFAEAKPFNGKVEFLVTDSSNQPTFVKKFLPLLRVLSGFNPLDIDYQVGTVHCFPSLLIGHKHRSEKELSLENSGTRHTVQEFVDFAGSVFHLQKARPVDLPFEGMRIPRVLIIERKGSRAITNANSVYEVARRLGMKVLVHELESDIEDIAQAVNVCDVVLGVYGSGLTSAVFLPENSVVIQIVPFGVPEELPSRRFRDPVKGMGMRYVEYVADSLESSVGDGHPTDHVAVANPTENAVLRIKTYLSQNVTLNITRFQATLVQALDLLDL